VQRADLGFFMSPAEKKELVRTATLYIFNSNEETVRRSVQEIVTKLGWRYVDKESDLVRAVDDRTGEMMVFALGSPRAYVNSEPPKDTTCYVVLVQFNSRGPDFRSLLKTIFR